MKQYLAIALSTILLTACATPYQSEGAIGGFGEDPAPGGLHKIYFSGNGHTAPEVSSAFMIRRAAELSKQLGKPYFAMYESVADAAVNKKTSVPSMTIISNHPIATAYVQYHDSKQPGDFSADAVLRKYAVQPQS